MKHAGKMVNIHQTMILKLNFEMQWMKLKIFFCIFPNPWALGVSGMVCYTLKMWKNPKSLHPIICVCVAVASESAATFHCSLWAGGGGLLLCLCVCVCVCVTTPNCECYATRQKVMWTYVRPHMLLWDHQRRRPDVKGLPHLISAPSFVLPGIRTHILLIMSRVRCSNQRAS